MTAEDTFAHIEDTSWGITLHVRMKTQETRHAHHEHKMEVGYAARGGVKPQQTLLHKIVKHGVAMLVASGMQQELCKRVAYSIEGKNITFYADGKPLTTVTSTTKDMGEFYDDPIWIGEQFNYLVGKKLTLCFTPGLSFVTGKVLIYDDMPTFAATVDLNQDGFKVSDIRLVGTK